MKTIPCPENNDKVRMLGGGFGEVYIPEDGEVPSFSSYVDNYWQVTVWYKGSFVFDISIVRNEFNNIWDEVE